VQIGDLATAEVEKISTEVTDAAVQKTVDILRKQRRVFVLRGQAGANGETSNGLAAHDGDRVTIDFMGKIDGVAFDGGTASDFVFILGDGRMLPEFEAAAKGMVTGEEKTFDLKFPDDYHGKDVAGKTAQFTLTMKKVEWPQLPTVDSEFAKTLGIADGDVDKLKADIRKNLEREVSMRLLARNKQTAFDALLKVAQLDVPKALVQSETENMVQSAREDLKQRGVKDADSAPIPAEMFTAQAERRVRLGLAVGKLVEINKLQATPEQIKAHIDELAQSYEKPSEVVTWYYSKRERLSEVEAVVVENNVTGFILANAKITEKAVPFDDVMQA
jgi:trigger factor